MKRYNNFLYVITALLSISVLSACSGGDGGSTNQPPGVKKTEKVSEDDARKQKTIELEIHGTDEMKYNKKELTVYEGQTVTLTLKHVGEMPMSAMGHNWVLLKDGVSLADFAKKAIQAADNDYIPEGEAEQIIAHTKMLGGGESDTITFKAPAKGTYTFICTFPGHYAMMQGKFIVK